MTHREKFDPITISENSIEIENPSKEESNIIRNCMLENRINTEEYKKRTDACAFLQCNHNDYLLIEFWTRDYSKITPFIEMINRKFEESRKD